MPLAALITSAITAVLGTAIARLMLGAGLAFVTYQAIDGYIEGFLIQATSSFSGLPADMFQLLVMAGVPEALEILGSAILTVVAIRLADRVVGLRLTGG